MIANRGVSRALRVGIVNATSDSFSGDGGLTSSAVWHRTVERYLEAGCRVVDVGAISTRPGASTVELEEEKRRLSVALSWLVEFYGDRLSISLDSFCAETVAWALSRSSALSGCPVRMVNDQAGGVDPEMGRLARRYDCDYIAMHGGPWGGVGREDSLEAVLAWGMGKREDFLREGFDLSRCWLDPGFGFGKTVGLQWRMVESMAQLVRAWSPVRVWVGHSRKSFLDDGPPSWRAWWLRGDENLWYRRDRQTSCLSRWFDGCGVGAVRVHAPWVESMDEEYDHATSDFSFDVWSSAS